jgi:transcriptional regulator with XRE-family HTH domain
MRRLQVAREQFGYTRADLDRLAGLPRGRAAAIERGAATPRRDGVELLRLALVLGLPASAAGELLDEVLDEIDEGA